MTKLHRSLLTSLSGVAILGVATLSRADYTMSVAHPFRVEVGIIWPSNASLSATTTKDALMGGVSYDFVGTSAKSTSPAYGGMYVDAFYAAGNGLHVTVTGVGAQGRAYLSSSRDLSFYVGAGLGAYFLNSNFTKSSNNVRLGGKLFAGAEIQQGVFVEVGYTLVSVVDGTNASGFQALIGYHF